MNHKNVEQVNGYARLIVRELHAVVMDEAIFDKLKTVLGLAEELEIYMENLNRKGQQQSNVVPFIRKPA